MRTVTEINEEFGMLDENGQINYLFNKYIGIDQQNPFTYNPNTFELTVYMRYLIEEGRMDLVGLEPEIARALVQGTFTEQFVQENYPASYGKVVYPDCTGHSVGQMAGVNAGQLTVWFD